MIDATHDPNLRSWVASANDGLTDFPIQNLPFGKFRRADAADAVEPWRIGVAIGDRMLDLKLALESGAWDPASEHLLVPLADGDLNAFMALGPSAHRSMRMALSAALRKGSGHREVLQLCLLPQPEAEMSVPCAIGDYTDFYTSIHHATSVGSLFRPDNPLLPNYKWMPIGYHGRSSSIGVSGQRFARPRGQTRPAGASTGTPLVAPSQLMDYELEMGVFIGRGNALGQPIAVEQADDHVFGLCLLNDWSARDLQAWEYQPLGPFLSKNFATTISPWIVTLEALAPYRTAWTRPAEDPQPLPYLDAAALRASGAIDIRLEVLIQSARMREQDLPAHRVSLSNFRHAYWTVAQMLAHHTVNGCNLRPGDLLGSGTQSGPGSGEEGSLIEVTRGGKAPFGLPTGERRTFLEDGDSVIMRGVCEKPGVARIGFGEVVGTLLPAAVRAN